MIRLSRIDKTSPKPIFPPNSIWNFTVGDKLRLTYSIDRIQTAIFDPVTTPIDLTRVFKARKKSLKIRQIFFIPAEICMSSQRLFLSTHISKK